MPVAVVSESFATRAFSRTGSDRPPIWIRRRGEDHRRRRWRHSLPRPRAHQQRAAGLPRGVAAARQLDRSFYAPQDLIVRTSVPPSTLMPAVRGDHQEGRSAIADHQHANARRSGLARDRAARGAAARARRFRRRLRWCWPRSASTACSRFRSARACARSASASPSAPGPRDIMWMVMGRSTDARGRSASRSARCLPTPRDDRCRRCSSASAPPMPRSSPPRSALSLLMTIAGSILPAWRAIRVDPITATRAD